MIENPLHRVRWFLENHKRIKQHFYSILPYIIFAFSYIIFFYRVLFDFQGYLAWGNAKSYLTPRGYSSVWIYFNPFLNNGTPQIIPFVNLEVYLVGLFQSMIAATFGTREGFLSLMFLSCYLFTVSSYKFVGTLTKNKYIALTGSFFFSFNPFQIEIIAQGDFDQLLFFAAFAFSLYLLILSFKLRKPINFHFIISLSLLLLTSAFFQLFYTGIMLYFLINLFFALSKWRDEKLERKDVMKYVLRPFLIILVAAPIIASYLFPPFTLGQSTLIGISPAQFISTKTSVVNLILLRAYPPNIAFQSVSYLGKTLLIFWESCIAFLVASFLIIAIINRDVKMTLLILLVLLSSVIGSESFPFSGMDIFLFEHLPGYRVLNYPYFWDWLIIAPVYSLLLVLTLDHLWAFKNTVTHHKGKSYLLKIPLFHHSKNSMKQWVPRSILVGISAVILITPVASQGYYNNPHGVHDNFVPLNYKNLTQELANLTGNNYFGVLVLNPDPFIYYNNTFETPVNDPVYYGNYRTPGITSYNSLPLESDFYFNWLFENFYQNNTRSFGQLLSLVGYKYVVTLYNTNAADFYPYFMPYTRNVNATELMSYQHGFNLIQKTNTYAVFENEEFNSIADMVYNNTLLMGNFPTLNRLSSIGVNLSNQAILFPADFARNLSYFENTTKTIVLSTNASVDGLNLLLNGKSDINSVDYLTPNGAWKNNIQYEVSGNPLFINYPFPFSYVNGRGDFKIPISGVQHQSEIWIQVLSNQIYQGGGGDLQFLLNGKMISVINTHNQINGVSNGFSWIKINANLANKSDTLEINSLNGANAIGKVYIEKRGFMENASVLTEQLIQKNHIKVITLIGGENVAPSGNSSGYYFGTLENGESGGSFVYLQGNHSFSIPTFGPNGQGYVYLLVQNTSIMEFNASGTQKVIVNTGNYNSKLSNYFWIGIPVNVSNYVTYLKIKSCMLANIAEILYFNGGLPSFPSMLNRFNLSSPTTVYRAPTVNSFSYGVNTSNNSTIISGNLNYSTNSSDLLALIGFRNILPKDSRIFLSVTGSNRVLIDVGSISFIGKESIATDINSNLLSQAKSNKYFTIQFYPYLKTNGSNNITYTVQILGYTNYDNAVYTIGSELHQINATFAFTQNGYSVDFTNIVNGKNETLVFRLPWFFEERSYAGTLYPELYGINTLVILNSNYSNTYQVQVSIVRTAVFYYGVLIMAISLVSLSILAIRNKYKTCVR